MDAPLPAIRCDRAGNSWENVHELPNGAASRDRFGLLSLSRRVAGAGLESVGTHHGGAGCLRTARCRDQGEGRRDS